jgi:hypothetical protein
MLGNMAFDLNSFIGGNIAEAFAKVVGVFKVSPEATLAAQTELTQIQLELQGKLIDQVSAQMDINKVEAGSTSIFVAGWRPAIGWICGLGLGVQFLVNPLATWFAALAGHPIAFPSLDLGTLMTLLFGMLGLAAARTYEKAVGVTGAGKLN